MNNKFYPLSVFIFLFLAVTLITPLISVAQIQGFVFRDINNDGARQITNPVEPGEFGITVNAYNTSNILVASVATNAAGNYSFSVAQIPSGTPVRLEFNPVSGNFPSKRINADRSNIQFVMAGPAAVNIDFAIASKKLAANNSNPYVATTAFTNGDANGIGGSNNAGQYNNLYVFPYDLSSDGGNSRRAANKYLGAVFGLAWQKESRVLLMAAYLKRHSSFGPGGIGAIYKSQISNTGNPSTPTLLVNVSAIGINVGTNPRTGALPTDATQPNTDNGVFANVGKTGIGGMELSDDGRDLYIVNMYEKKLHRINVGNPLKATITAADVTGSWVIPDPSITGTEWRPMTIKLKDGKFYIGGITTKETTTAHNIADTANLRGVVYQFDPATNVFTEVLRFPLSHRRGNVNADYRYQDRNNYWCAWQNNGDVSIGGPLRTGLIGTLTGGNATGIYYPQPMFSAIEFDAEGSMIIGIRDRFGDQGGYANFFETGNVPGETYRSLATGEVLRAGKNGNIWLFENGGSVTSNGVTTTTPGVTDNNPALTGSFPGMTGTPWGGSYGPGGKYYYYNFNYSLTGVPAPFNSGATITNHYLKSNGGLAYLPGYNEVMTTAIDPMNTAYTNGLIKNVNLGAQAGNMCARMNLTASNGTDPAGMGKSAALGDIEILEDAQSMEIGNRVWEDKNFNGIQDADEPGIAGVQVDLRSPGADNIYNTGDDQVWTLVTDANGNYYFDETIVNDNRRPAEWIGVSSTHSGILPGFEYRLEILKTQTSLNSLLLSPANAAKDEIDSEGGTSGPYIYHTINAGGTLATGSGFDNNYNIDFGFSWYAILATNKIEAEATLNSNTVTVNWKTIEEASADFYEVERSTNGTGFAKIGSYIIASGNSFLEKQYRFQDDISSVQHNGILYYRVKLYDKLGGFKYSNVASVKLKSLGIKVWPNPFAEMLQVSITSQSAGKVDLRISDAAGRVVITQQQKVSAGMNQLTLPGLSRLSKGTYIVEVINLKDNRRDAYKLTKE